MRKRVTVGLLLVNALLGLALIAMPAKTQVIPRSILDCCKTVGGDPICCYGCCWFTRNCQDHSDCRIEESLGG